MDYDRPRVKCQCGWVGQMSDWLVATSPFNAELIKGCPACKTIVAWYAADVDLLCQHQGCDAVSEGGRPVGDGEYLLVCSAHWQPKDGG